MRERLPKDILEILAQVGLVAAELKFRPMWWEGLSGTCCSSMRTWTSTSSLKGTPSSSPGRFAARFGARSREFQKFKTAVIIFPDGFKIDVATARTEYYESPGALPIVEYSSIKMDLYRRDFTINTLALKLNPGGVRHPAGLSSGPSGI